MKVTIEQEFTMSLSLSNYFLLTFKLSGPNIVFTNYICISIPFYSHLLGVSPLQQVCLYDPESQIYLLFTGVPW